MNQRYSASCAVTVDAPAGKVWEALTTPALIKKYFFGTTVVTDWKVGSPVSFRGEWQGKTYEDKGTVLSFEPGKGLSFNYWSSFSGIEDLPDLRQIIAYGLRESGAGVEVSIHQSNCDTQERADHSVSNWKSVLEGLKKLVEADS